MKKYLLLAISVVISYSLFCQSPQKMSYQCVVRHNNNLVMDQPVGMRISILQGTPTGTVVYQEIYNPNPQTNANGLVTIEIGTGIKITGTFSSINWAEGPFFLKTEIDPAGGTNYLVTGTTQLLSVPYALYAEKAGNVFSGNYNDLTNKPVLFDGTWPSLTWKPNTVSGFGISDAMTTAHPANSVSAAYITNWNTAYGWGNHAAAGYVPGTRTITINGTTLSLTANNTWNVGTVTSVGLSLPSIFSVSGSPVTSLGTLSASLASQSANRVFASPNGTTGTPSFRALVSSDIPYLDWSKITTGKPTTLPGYGITDAMSTSHPANSVTVASISNWTTAFSWGDHSIAGYAKYPSQTGNSGKYLTTNGTITSWASLATVAVTGNYNDLTNKPIFDGSFASLTGKPTTVSGYGITDAMTTAHPANSISATYITNWNTAYGWGNHATAGYVPGTRTITINGTTLSLSANNTWNVGTVTSVGLSLPSIFSVSGSPVTSLGTLSASLASQSANRVFASPDGTTGTPVFRYLVSNDIPNLDWSKITTGKPTTVGGYGITNAMTTAHPANSITSTWINYWNTAYSWGNHAGLYKPYAYVPDWAEITSKPTTLAGYGITDAVNTTGNQTIAGNKTFKGTISAGLNTITNVADPVNDQDAATKNYVDMLLAEIEYLKQISGISTVTDIDGNIYKTIQIGNQVWMAENLKVVHYRNGDPIPNVTDGTEWGLLITGAYCNYNNNSTYVSTYGRLYNAYAVLDSRNIAPEGWHVATRADYQTLEAYLGGSDIAGGKMKETGTSTWVSPNTGATNSSGFTGRPGGYRGWSTGIFASLRTEGTFWCSTPLNETTVYGRILYYDEEYSFETLAYKHLGFYVRCVKD